jgi:peptide/nickel transport system substrate-binding protein
MLYLQNLNSIMIKKLFITLFVSAILVSCVKKRDLSQNTVIAHITVQPDGLHPFNDNSAIRSYIFNYTQKTLIKLDINSLDYIPSLVKNMPTASEDNLSFEYEIKRGVIWDDGTELNAEDVAFSVKLMLCPLTNNAQIRSNYTTVIKSIELDPNNPMKFIMHAQNIHWDNKFIFSELFIQQKSLWDPKRVLDNVTFENLLSENFNETEVLQEWFNEYNNADNSYKPNLLTGLGAYQVTQWEASQYITIEKKENWWGAKDTSVYNKAYPEKIIFKIITEDASSYLALKNQEIDVTTRIGTVKLMKLQEREYFNDNYDSDFLDQYSFSYMGLNMKPDGIKQKPFFVDQKVRRAMAYLIPIDEIIEVMMHGKGSRQASLISPLKSTYNDTLKLIPLDIEKAKKLLAEAGWIDTDGDNIRDRMINGVKIPFSFKLSYMSSPISKEIVLMIKESLYKAGVVAEPTPMDFTLFYKNAMDHNFDGMMGGWGGSASYSNPMQLWHTSSWVTKGSNFCGFGDAESDALIEEANLTLDKEKHNNALLKLQAKVYEDQPYVFLYATKRKFAIHKRFNNRGMYNERPGVMLQNLDLRPEFSSKNLAPTNGQ